MLALSWSQSFAQVTVIAVLVLLLLNFHDSTVSYNEHQASEKDFSDLCPFVSQADEETANKSVTFQTGFASKDTASSNFQ